MSRNAGRFVRFGSVAVLGIGTSCFGFFEEHKDLDSLLTKETAGEVVSREGRVSIDSPAFEAWQSGHIREANGWTSYDQVAQPPKDQEYIKKRDELNSDPEKHLKLAHWCIRNQLPERARAHYFGVLASQPNNVEARAFVGHVFLGTNWVDLQDFGQAQKNMKATMESLDEWVPKVGEIVSALKSNNTKSMSRALTQLESLPTEDAMPALTFFASNIDDDFAKPLIRRIASVRSRAACEALVRVALNHPSDAIRLLTCSSIREYDRNFYVPELLQMLADEAQMQYRLISQPNGRIAVETVFHHELRDRKQVERSQKMFHVVSTFSSKRNVTFNGATKADISYWSEFWKVSPDKPVHFGNYKTHDVSFGKGTSQFRVNYVPRMLAENVTASLNEEVQQYQRELAKRNRDQKVVMNRIYAILRETTKLELEDNPKLWWASWNEYSERYEGAKPINVSNKYQMRNIVASTSVASTDRVRHELELGQIMIQYSCLVPGTLIQTSKGLVPIGSIQIGDYVLSQDVETAELTYRPVILTTIRPPKDTIKIRTEKDQIEATGGHLWWVSGKGWIKSRDLSPGMVFHTVKGTAAIESVESNPELKTTHNLVVDGFHTYFVGESRILSYDNSNLVPTVKLVPGVAH